MQLEKQLVGMMKQLSGVRDISKNFNEEFTEDRVEEVELVAGRVTLGRELELEPSIEEVIKCLNKLKSGKAVGSSGIVAEMLKAGSQLLAALCKFFGRVGD